MKLKSENAGGSPSIVVNTVVRDNNDIGEAAAPVVVVAAVATPGGDPGTAPVAGGDPDVVVTAVAVTPVESVSIAFVGTSEP